MTDKLRIDFLSPSREQWGAETSMLALHDSLGRLGHSVRVNSALKSLYTDSSEIEGHFVDFGPGRVGQILRAIPELARTRRDTVVVLFHETLLPAAWLLRPLLAWKKVTVALDMHNTISTPRGLKRLGRYSTGLKVVICVSEYIAAQFPRRTRTQVVYRPIAARGEAVRDPHWDAVRFGIVGRVDSDKNIKLGIEAMALLPQEVPFSVVVRGAPSESASSYLDEIIELAHNKLGERFAYEGVVANNAALDNVDILIFLNSREPSGRIIAEAQMAGVLVVGPDKGGASEFIEDGATGFKYHADNAPHLAEVLRAVLSDSTPADHVRRAGRAFALAEYDAITQASRYASALKG